MLRSWSGYESCPFALQGRLSPQAAVRDLVARYPATVWGRLGAVRSLAGAGVPTFEADISDMRGSVAPVLCGRRSTPGLVPGTKLEGRGTRRAYRGRTEILNPLYELLAPLGDSEMVRQTRDLGSNP
ncbi:MAG: hypothetical protein M0008_00075 [Actinomycetota bacterium]|jgi:hypothetical protein|nr:hypothetical protein [Actinomycetota bacterium]